MRSGSSRVLLVHVVLLLALAAIAASQFSFDDDAAAWRTFSSQSEQPQLKRDNNLNNMFRIGKRKLGNMMRLG